MIKPYRNIQINNFIKRFQMRQNVSQKWKINNRWYSFSDMKSSGTLEIVYNEIVRGLYWIDRNYLLENDVVIDLGAHVGMFCIPLASENPSLKIIAFEPNPTNYKNLLRNLKKNKITNVIAINKGILDESQRGLASEYPLNNTGSSITIVDDRSRVKSITWDEIKQLVNKWFSTDKISVLKCDIEGAEFLAFKNKNDFNNISCIRMEIHGDKGNAHQLASIIHETSKDYILQVLEKGIKRDYANPFKPVTNLDGQTVNYIMKYGLNK